MGSGIVCGQEKEMKKAIKKGADADGIYVAYPSALSKNDYKKWLSKNNDKYRVVKTTTESTVRFGMTDDFVKEIYFVPAAEVEAYEKRQAKTIAERIAVRTKYPDYRITDMSIKEIDDGFLSTYVISDPFSSSEKRQRDVDLERIFLKTFPEYKNNTELQEQFLTRLNGKRNHKTDIYIKDFITCFQDYKAAESFTYSLMGNRNYTWIKDAIRCLIGHVDLTRILNAAIDQKRDNVTTIITKFIDFTGNEYFSKNNINEYFVSAEACRQLFQEIKSCTAFTEKQKVEQEIPDLCIPQMFKVKGAVANQDLLALFPDKKEKIISEAIPLRIKEKGAAAYKDLLAWFPDRKEAIALEIIPVKINESGAAAWRDLFTWFPDSKDKILSEMRHQYVHRVSYSKMKWSPDIKWGLSNAESTWRNLNSYIDAVVPDNEGMQLAKQYRNEAYSVMSRYRSDLSPAESYESSLKRQVEKIRRDISYAFDGNRLTVPPYTVTYTSQFGMRTIINITIDGTIRTDFEEEQGQYRPHNSTNKYSTLGRAVIEEMLFLIKFDSCWECFKSAYDMERAKKIVSQYERSGIREWYRMNR
jgi:hypothetical protein